MRSSGMGQHPHQTRARPTTGGWSPIRAAPKLPMYQRAHPLYDRYFLRFFNELAEQTDFAVVDVGANVGDTAVAIASVADGKPTIISVEGSPHFLPYLRRNTERWVNVQVVDAFVAPGVGGSFGYDSDRSTGRLVELDGEADGVDRWTAVAALLDRCTASLVVWKTDTDGHDASILLENFDAIFGRCDVVWTEWDPVSFGTDPDTFSALAARLGELGREIVIFDNFGHRMLRTHGPTSATLLGHLNEWLLLQRTAGEPRVYYLDVWVLGTDLADRLWRTAGTG